jgi:hypothetical protein
MYFRGGSGMTIFKFAVTALATLAVLLGLLWMGQGLGLVHWPAESFMIGMGEWTVRGAMLAAAGLLLIVLARRT